MSALRLATRRCTTVLALAALLGLTACAVTPTAPQVAVMPAPGKPFEQFAAEEQECRSYAQQSIGGADAAASSNQRAVGAAVLGTAIGAAAGTALGSHRRGTQEGAGAGLLIGSAVGANESAAGTQSLQRRYDLAYEQCMYAKGNQIPSASYAQPQRVRVARPTYQVAPALVYAPAPAAYPPPPPPPPGYAAPPAAYPPPPGYAPVPPTYTPSPVPAAPPN